MFSLGAFSEKMALNKTSYRDLWGIYESLPIHPDLPLIPEAFLQRQRHLGC
jgi:hypothetical protein